MRALARALVPGLLVAAPAAGAVVETMRRAAHAALGRDQGIFQYIAWASMHGELLYRDVRDVNGPLVAMLHAFVLHVLGPSERAFRVFDLLVTGAAFAMAGASLVDLLDDAGGSRLARLASRLSWAAAGWVVLSAQYLAYGFWDTAQRESFFDVFVLVALAAALAAQRLLAAPHASARGQLLLVLAGASSFLPCAGKPTFALFTVAQVATLLVDDLPSSRTRRLALFLGGGLLGLAPPAAFLFLRGDPAAFLRISTTDVPTMYRFIWPRPWHDMVATWAPVLALGCVTSLCALGLVGARILPRRALALALLPGLGISSALAQEKGFPYHFHPATAGAWLAVLAASRVAFAGAWRRGRPLGIAVAASLALAIGGRVARSLEPSPFPPATPGLAEAAPERLALYERVDYFPRALRDAADFVRAHTTPDERVMAYGMDAYLLFLAERRSATPFIYAYDLDVDAALAGASVYGGAVPTEAQRAKIRAIQARHARELAAGLVSRPPAAVVFVGRSPLMTQPDAVVDFDFCCAEAARFVHARYEEVADFDGIRVWLPRNP